MATSKFRGHDIETNKENIWVFSDTKTPVSEDKNERPCNHCGKNDTDEGHDGCLGTLIGTMNACCGHGVSSEAYIQFLDKECLRGESALVVMNELKQEEK